MGNRVGVLLIGAGGAVASTVIAGVALMRRGAPRYGMITEGPVGAAVGACALDDLVFGGWDLKGGDLYEAALTHAVVPREQLGAIESELRSMRPWPGVSSAAFLANNVGDHVVPAKSFRDELRVMREQVTAFQRERGLDRVVMVNLTSTERYVDVADVHRTVEAFEAGLDADDARISPAMKYLYLAITMGIPHANFTPSRSNVPALEALAGKRGVPIAGEDGKTGQTFLKTVLAPAFVVRDLRVDGWYSTNILGNNDGKVLDDPGSNKTKVVSKKSVLDEILGYPVPDHQVHIHYYRPRGDQKEAWDNIDLLGFLGEPMQLKVNFLCKDSILAAPLVLDLVRLLDAAQRAGEKGVQQQLSLFFKSPYRVNGETPVHDLFAQNRMLHDWVARVAPTLRAAPAA
jgi:myo-inositol-1-phosphate synthase